MFYFLYLSIVTALFTCFIIYTYSFIYSYVTVIVVDEVVPVYGSRCMIDATIATVLFVFQVVGPINEHFMPKFRLDQTLGNRDSNHIIFPILI